MKKTIDLHNHGTDNIIDAHKRIENANKKKFVKNDSQKAKNGNAKK